MYWANVSDVTKWDIKQMNAKTVKMKRSAIDAGMQDIKEGSRGKGEQIFPSSPKKKSASGNCL